MIYIMFAHSNMRGVSLLYQGIILERFCACVICIALCVCVVLGAMFVFRYKQEPPASLHGAIFVSCLCLDISKNRPRPYMVRYLCHGCV